MFICGDLGYDVGNAVEDCTGGFVTAAVYLFDLKFDADVPVMRSCPW